ncbi:SPOR domain-containing protein [Halomonas sp. CKK8]|uniref:SPOR domain-containing protein n=1 Tax=Halomonas sp. CKK8 TaxID=3036127 RepID=UPI0024155B01|nr:SPOR domain-containing protein [Halomonas sp. CKK8]WFM69944.1 SPOR domain-containing protein [Halomonas sp. CKK8]
MRERLSGAVILIALAVIFVPMLFDDPAPRSERPQPVMTIEQPVEVERRDVPDPEPPASLGQIQSPVGTSSPAGAGEARIEPEAEEQAVEAVADAEPATPETTDSESFAGETAEGRDEASEDPIAELARAADERLSGQAEQAARETPEATPEGEWAVQVGSFGEPANAERLESNLAAQGLPVYSRARDNGLTTVYVGPYATSREGEDVMARLKAESNLQGLLVRAGN